MKHLVRLTFGIVIFLIPLAVFAVGDSCEPPKKNDSPDVKALKGKKCICSGCHDGTLTVDGAVEVKVNQSRPGIPNLSGQHKDYLVRQLYEFKCERRKSGAMNPLAKILDEKDIADLADWAADVSSYIQDCILIKSEYPECKDAGFTETAKIVKECGACHDQNDDPNDSDGLGRCRGSDSDQYCYPRLAGQKAEYLYKQLENFRSNERKSNVMNPMAKRIKDHDEVNTNMLACIAQYYCKKYK